MPSPAPALPASAPRARLPEEQLAERGQRLLAATYDELILMGISLPILFGVFRKLIDMVSAGVDAELLDPFELINSMLQGPGMAITLVLSIAWCVITAWLVESNGQTIGKRIVGIKVVRTDGTKASLARIFLLRNVVNMLPTLVPQVGWLYLLVDPLLIYQESRQCLHDKIADTNVVRCAIKPRPGADPHHP